MLPGVQLTDPTRHAAEVGRRLEGRVLITPRRPGHQPGRGDGELAEDRARVDQEILPGERRDIARTAGGGRRGSRSS